MLAKDQRGQFVHTNVVFVDLFSYCLLVTVTGQEMDGAVFKRILEIENV